MESLEEGENNLAALMCFCRNNILYAAVCTEVAEERVDHSPVLKAYCVSTPTSLRVFRCKPSVSVFEV
jgi:hypothetical protein